MSWYREKSFSSEHESVTRSNSARLIAFIYPAASVEKRGCCGSQTRAPFASSAGQGILAEA